MNKLKILAKKLLAVDIVKVFSLNAVATFVRMLAGLISVKVIAVIIGPAGVALLGQLKNFETILIGLANGGINNGITKYVSEYKEDEQKTKLYISNALKITLICTAIIAVILIFGSYYLSKAILLSADYTYVFIVFGFTIILYSLNTVLISIINGYKQFKKYVVVNICGTLFGLVYSVILVFLWELPGALINAVTYQSIVFFVTLWLCRDLPWMKKEYFAEKLDKEVVKKYFNYSLMTLTTLALVPVSRMFLRGYVISEISATEAGIWEGMNNISTMYLNVLVSSLSIYYLPRMSELSNPKELHNELFHCYKFVIPILLVLGVAFFLLRDFIIWFLFTPEFESMRNLFSWQLIGDFFKMCSWLLAYIMVAKAKTKTYITTEVVFTLLYLVFAFVLLKLNGILGLVQGYLVNYVLYMITMCILFRNIIKVEHTNNK